ncbi:hypothetical protein HMPREF1211_03537 [Streptomyces sp. HGB0020]|nr:hypothetical protein HMPREF1211_03537 [Streptomyces sp. HGB0020]
MTRRERRMLIVYVVTIVVLAGALAWGIANCGC